MSMKTFIQANWSQIKIQLKAKYKWLTDNDLKYDEGSEEQLVRKLQLKLQLDHQELLTELKQIITKPNK